MHPRPGRNPALFSRICFSRTLVGLWKIIPGSNLDATLARQGSEATLNADEL